MNDKIDNKLIQKVNNLVAMTLALIQERDFFIGLTKSFTEYVEVLKEKLKNFIHEKES